jgi:hypothetical protein
MTEKHIKIGHHAGAVYCLIADLTSTWSIQQQQVAQFLIRKKESIAQTFKKLDFELAKRKLS